MFRTFTCPPSGVLIYKVVSLPHVVLCPRCCGCGPTELVCGHVHCLSVSFQNVNVQNIYENKTIVKLFASSWCITLGGFWPALRFRSTVFYLKHFSLQLLSFIFFKSSSTWSSHISLGLPTGLDERGSQLN